MAISLHRRWYVPLALVVLGVITFLFLSLSARAEAPREVRWLLSHQPTDVFARAAQVFADELEKESGGRLSLVIVTPAQIGVAQGDVPNAKVFELLDSGAVELATAYTVPLGEKAPALWALNLPFLFDTYDEASDTLDAEAGQDMLAALSDATTARGLAFTMSGGFRIIASKNTQIRSVSDLKGKRVATSGGPVAEATLKALGAVPVPTDLESGPAALDSKSIDGIETTYSRLSAVLSTDTEYKTYVNETNHSIFLTAILASDAFYDSLSAGERAALEEAARAAARVEREDSIALGATTKSALEQDGSTVSEVSAAERETFRAATVPVYAQFTQDFGEYPAALVERR